MNGTIITIAAGGALRERRAKRFAKDARMVAGRWLVDNKRAVLRGGFPGLRRT